MRKAEWKGLSRENRKIILSRHPVEARSNRELVSKILSDVKESGDQALEQYTREFDQVTLKNIEVSRREMGEARSKIHEKTARAIETAAKRIEAFHQEQKQKDYSVEISPGVRCEKIWRPIDRVGLYVPGGNAPLVSTVLMLGIPARIAGVPLRILASPPNRETGAIHPAILFAAKVAGIERVFQMGGAQAIAAMAYGTLSVPKVDRIYGPGNSWVTEAKLQVSCDPDGAAQEFPAGPSEVLVIADEKADARFVASDLLSQAEHGADSQCILLSPSKSLIEKVEKEIERQTETLPRRETVIAALSYSSLIQTSDVDEAINISNEYAPEHLILQVENPRRYLSQVKNAGSVFLGAYSPETAGDYASGTNHVLPTYGYARAYGGLGVESFLKPMSVQEISKEGLQELSSTLLTLAEAEGLEAHARAVRIRMDSQ